MSEVPRLVLSSFQDGRAVLDIAYAGRRARLELDRLEDIYEGQPTAERAEQEIRQLVTALRGWLDDPERTIEAGEP